MSLEYIGKYYGPHSILEVKEEGDFVVMTLERDKQETYEMKITKFAFGLCVSDEKKDWNYVVDTKINHMISRFIEVSMDYGVTGGEMNTVVQKLTSRYSDILDRAVSYLITKDDKKFVPGGSVYYDFSLNDAHEITRELDGK